MERDDRQQLKATAAETSQWADSARSILARRVRVNESAIRAETFVAETAVTVRLDGLLQSRVVPVHPALRDAVGALASRAQLPEIPAADQHALEQLAGPVWQAVQDTRAVTGHTRFFRGAAAKERGGVAARYLQAFQAWGQSRGIRTVLNKLSETREADVEPFRLLEDWIGFRAAVPTWGQSPEMLDAAQFAGLRGSLNAIDRAVKDEGEVRARAIASGEKVRRAEVDRILAEMPVVRLKEATADRIRISALTEAGLTTVKQVLDQGGGLQALEGIGPTTAQRMQGAAQTLWHTAYEEMPVRIDIARRRPETTKLLAALQAWRATRDLMGSSALKAQVASLRPLAARLDNTVTHLAVFPEGASVDSLTSSIKDVVSLGQTIGRQRGDDQVDPWEAFLANPADYFSMLAELGFLLEDEKKTHGDLSDDLIEAVRAVELRGDHLTASLRGYQGFAARFAVAQRKVIIGDEMGLGKTVEALAVLAHLSVMGSLHFIVVCPAAVVTNWVREISTKSRLRAHRLHGSTRDQALRSWRVSGGVAVTTFETLAWLEQHLKSSGSVEIACVVVDEAHYIKNPAALRSQRTSSLVESAKRAILLTGTPLENRIEEFRTLVRYVKPDLVVDTSGLSPRLFRKQVAPAYLRRNQEDVLVELPELVEVEEWLPMNRSDSEAYRDAVRAGNFMAMRQAASLTRDSEKLRRLVEIVSEAEDNGRKVIVFSHFRKVLDEVMNVLTGTVVGPLTGSVPAIARQRMVDEFTAAGHGAALVSQIQAGGVGLNIQAASVVVICEPQLKPTVEWQAIARARRMGQLESVQVHRLLSEEGVDLRLTEILATKRQTFEDFARESETASSAPEAYDVSEAELARQVIASERERLLGSHQPG